MDLFDNWTVQGLVQIRLDESSPGPTRKYYSLTAKGRKTAAVMKDHLQESLFIG